jgi:hypothetical protein
MISSLHCMEGEGVLTTIIVTFKIEGTGSLITSYLYMGFLFGRIIFFL